MKFKNLTKNLSYYGLKAIKHACIFLNKTIVGILFAGAITIQLSVTIIVGIPLCLVLILLLLPAAILSRIFDGLDSISMTCDKKLHEMGIEEALEKCKKWKMTDEEVEDLLR